MKYNTTVSWERSKSIKSWCHLLYVLKKKKNYEVRGILLSGQVMQCLLMNKYSNKQTYAAESALQYTEILLAVSAED